ncbi:hypothetical protein LAZ67_16000325 [Cordylochernes scorpioides]|uniref:Mariner Mos1 transposase n=1 Tax=Cordylochernes scorpioides TaxID=51811 RepID=A0ABY6LAJ5_9ARAC|nr:hypothetical protein LAZ67_16000325 [Cordylochernes scorpioides]
MDDKWVCLVNHSRHKRWGARGQELPSVARQNRFAKVISEWWNFEDVLHFELAQNPGKEERVNACEDWLLNIHEDPNFLTKVITGDETWVYGYDPETKRQSSQWLPKNAPKPKKARISKSKTKVLLVTYFDHQGIVHYQFLPQEQTINQHRFYAVYGNQYGRNDRKSGSRANGCFITITPQHTDLLGDFLTKNSMFTMPHPSYSPDLAPNDFFLFPRMKSVPKGHRFDTVNAIKEKSLNVLRSITSNEFSGCFQNW